MSRLFARHDLRRPQLWILLWMLPYFVFSVWASPLHFHSPDGRDISLSALAQQSSTRFSPYAPHQIEKTSATKDAGECFLCEWSAYAAKIIAAATFYRPSQRAQIVAVETPQSSRFLLARISRNRGPPSVFSL